MLAEVRAGGKTGQRGNLSLAWLEKSLEKARIMNIDDALYTLGVRDDTLSAEEKDALDRNGYVPLPNILTSSQVQNMAGRLDELVRLEGENAGKEVHQEAGTDRLSDLVNK